VTEEVIHGGGGGGGSIGGGGIGTRVGYTHQFKDGRRQADKTDASTLEPVKQLCAETWEQVLNTV